ncbi:hypothetical protein ANN_08133 [Periplaneta americana]|uniref:Endonuclease-reverse transcriptase n=1 Tax=Periplaneta americana TaxID=6978 RepID=A0ABQ8T245_PERAM|nr:hypothetical protein ANN_08133 [Periplaneta americana]
MDLREVGYDDRDWINLVQDRDQWRAYVRAAVNLRIFSIFILRLISSMSKTEYLVIGGDGRNIKLPQGIIKIVKEFKYLGSVLHETGNCKADIDYRIMQGRGAIKMLNGVLWSRTITMQTKKRILEVIVENILTYGAEGWSLSEGQKSKIQAVEMDGIRRGARISRLEKRRNEDVRRIMNMEESVIARIESRQLQWYGHVRRMDEGRWPNVLLQWSPAGRKKRGRPRNSWKAGILRMMNDKGLNEQDWNDRRRWKMEIKGTYPPSGVLEAPKKLEKIYKKLHSRNAMLSKDKLSFPICPYPHFQATERESSSQCTMVQAQFAR